MSGRTLSVIGLGLIGGSLVRAADAAGWKVRGATRSEATATAAREAGFEVTTSVEDLLIGTASDTLVALAVPLPAVVDMLAVLARHAPRCRLTDVVSVK
nr:NAD(P)-binding domain-containing protein [Actinomycetota bacterium]